MSLSVLVSIVLVAIKLCLAVVIVGLSGVGAVLVVIDLAGQAVGGHALLRRHFVGAHLQGDGAAVTALQIQLLVKDVPPGSWSRHASLEETECNITPSMFLLFKECSTGDAITFSKV